MTETDNKEGSPTRLRILDFDGASSSMAAPVDHPTSEGGPHAEETSAAQEQRKEPTNGSEDKESGENSGQEEDFGENSGQESRPRIQTTTRRPTKKGYVVWEYCFFCRLSDHLYRLSN